MLGRLRRLSSPLLERYAFSMHSSACAHSIANGSAVGGEACARTRAPAKKLYAMPRYVCGGPAGAMVTGARVPEMVPVIDCML